MWIVYYKEKDGGLFGDSTEYREFNNYQSARVFARVKRGTITKANK